MKTVHILGTVWKVGQMDGSECPEGVLGVAIQRPSKHIIYILGLSREEVKEIAAAMDLILALRIESTGERAPDA